MKALESETSSAKKLALAVLFRSSVEEIARREHGGPPYGGGWQQELRRLPTHLQESGRRLYATLCEQVHTPIGGPILADPNLFVSRPHMENFRFILQRYPYLRDVPIRFEN